MTRNMFGRAGGICTCDVLTPAARAASESGVFGGGGAVAMRKSLPRTGWLDVGGGGGGGSGPDEMGALGTVAGGGGDPIHPGSFPGTRATGPQTYGLASDRS